MSELICVFIFILSFVLILKGGDMLVESSIWLACKAKIPPMVVGATIVSIATTFPETTVSFFSGLSGAENLAVSTAIGSMMCNFALVLGISFLCMPSKMSNENLASKVLYFLFSISILFLLALDKKLGVVDGIVLFIIFIIFILQNFFSVNKKSISEPLNTENIPSWTCILVQFFISAFSIGYGANILVSNVDGLSKILGVSEGVVGLIIISIGTNIPEFVTTMTSIKLKNSEIGLGNIFGSSIIDSTLLIAATVISSKDNQISMPSDMLYLTVPMLFLITFIIVIPVYKSGKSSRIQGAVLVFMFLLYSLIMSKIT